MEESKKTHMTFGGETDSSNPSRLIFSIKIPVNTTADYIQQEKMM